MLHLILTNILRYIKPSRWEKPSQPRREQRRPARPDRRPYRKRKRPHCSGLS